MRTCRFLFVVGLGLLLPSVNATTVFTDFEHLSDLDSVTTQYPGLTFSNTLVLTAGTTLNEIDFPPASGVNVITDDFGPITILLDTPSTSFSAYFTYVLPLTVEAFDSSDVSVASATSLFSDNDAFGGDIGSSPNEIISVLFAGGFSKVVITGDSFGGSFVMDDLSVTGSAVPEPSSLAMVLIAGFGGLVLKKRLRNT